MAKSKPKSNRVRVQVVGHNAIGVTGSMTLVSYKNETIAIDCGAYQATSKIKTYTANKNMFKDISLKSISAIVCSHLNFDHQGSICSAYNQGLEAKVYMVQGSYEIAELMYRDSLKIGLADCMYFDKKYGGEHKPLFEEEDIIDVLNNTFEFDYHEKFRVNQYMEVEFIPAGHIYLSAQICVYITDGSFKRKILATGDIGNLQLKKPTVVPFEPVKYANLVLGECTYAMAENKCTPKHKQEDLESLKKQIDITCNQNKGSMLIGCFALQRSLDILMDLYSVWEKTRFTYKVYLDTPLGINILSIIEQTTQDEIFDKLAKWDNMQLINSYEDTKSVLYSDEPKIILASSGFAMGGRILTYFTQILPSEKHCLVSAGYSSPDSNMGLVKQRKPIQIMNEGELKEYEVKCEILELKSFSSHMQSDDMLKYYTEIQCDKIVLNHGDGEKKYEFAELLDEKLRENCKTTRVYCINQGEYVEV